MILSKPNTSGMHVSYSSMVFDESAQIKTVLKNPNQFREAVIYDHISHLDRPTVSKFIRSPEAKAMIEAGTITYDTLDRLARVAGHKDKSLNMAICHHAKEEGDELWDELVKAKAEERRIMNELLDKYRSEVEPLAFNAYNEIIESCIPSEYR